MHEFIAKHQGKIAGTLSGFDRLVFRGHLRSITYPVVSGKSICMDPQGVTGPDRSAVP